MLIMEYKPNYIILERFYIFSNTIYISGVQNELPWPGL